VNFDLCKPCDNCPFRREGGIRLFRTEAAKLASTVLLGVEFGFLCHKTVVFEEDDGGQLRSKRHENEQHCAGALIFAEKNNVPTMLMRKAEQDGAYSSGALMSGNPAVAEVFDNPSEMVDYSEE
jgi:hypothetical protein